MVKSVLICFHLVQSGHLGVRFSFIPFSIINLSFSLWLVIVK